VFLGTLEALARRPLSELYAPTVAGDAAPSKPESPPTLTPAPALVQSGVSEKTVAASDDGAALPETATFTVATAQFKVLLFIIYISRLGLKVMLVVGSGREFCG
jgi:hypothetical protein